MAQAVLDPDRVRLQPLPDHGGVDVVVVAPPLIAGVVGRVDEDAVHLAGIGGQKGLERVQVVAVNDQVAVQRRLADPLLRVRFERSEGDSQMMVPDELLALEIQLGHAPPPSLLWPFRPIRGAASQVRAGVAIRDCPVGGRFKGQIGPFRVFFGDWICWA